MSVYRDLHSIGGNGRWCEHLIGELLQGPLSLERSPIRFATKVRFYRDHLQHSTVSFYGDLNAQELKCWMELSSWGHSAKLSKTA